MGNIAAGRKRDCRIEALRLVACFSVLILHFKPSTMVAGQQKLVRVLLTCLCTDAVGVFLLITGFFFFGRQSWRDRITTCLKRIVLPMFAYTLFIAIVYPLLIGHTVDYGAVFSQFAASVLTWNPLIHNSRHLWYLYMHAMIVLAYPLLKLIKDRLDGKKGDLLFMAAMFALLLANDMTGNAIFHAEMVPVTVFVPGCLFVIAGSIIYKHRSLFEGRPLVSLAAIAVLLLTNAGRAVYMRNLLNADRAQTHFYGWYTSVGFVCAASLAVFALSFRPVAADIINLLASNTLWIYVLHVVVQELASEKGLRGWVVATFLDGSETTLQFLKYTFIYCSLIFVLCSLVAFAVKIPLKIIKNKRPS
ncbi:MAG: acyltransferase [Oscillospiraceae bacterium]|nr:acyltransferase [Oscillospiraceae bacterium]